MIQSAVTICLVPEARKGPFVFHGDLAEACETAASLGFDAVEVFAPSEQSLIDANLKPLLEQHALKLAAVGTGAGMLLHGLSLSDPNPEQRAKASKFVQSIINFGAEYGAPAIIGSLQGSTGGKREREDALKDLGDSLNQLGQHAEEKGTVLLFEPLNRYETDLICTIDDGLLLLDSIGSNNIKLLADLFHMNIEEVDIAESIFRGGDAIGHVHFVDSNRRAAGLGHMDYKPITATLETIQYKGFASAEAFPFPDSFAAALQTIEYCHRYLSN